MRLPRLRLVASFLALAVCLSATSSAQAAAPTMRLQDPITDNYKASYNADPSRPELRTWQALKRIDVAGTTWAPVVPDEILVTSGGSIEVVAADGRSGTLTARTTSGPLGAPIWRIDPATASSGGRWGILATVTDRSALRSTKAAISLSLLVGGEQFGVGTVEYRYDPSLAKVPTNHIEYNGPGGRWYVGGIATRTNDETAPSVAPNLLAGAAVVARPRITQVTLPLRTTTRVVAMRVRGRAAVSTARITHLRVRIDAGRWGGWVAVRSAYSLVLPRGTATRTVRIQFRDSRGVSSFVAARRIRCICG